MNWLRIFRRARRDRDVVRDIRIHLDIETDENIARGMSPEDARIAARKKFGNPEFVREDVYRMHSLNFIETLWKDLVYAVRQMRNKPTFAATIVITLALGIGATAAVFSIVEAVLLQPLPYKDPSKLVAIWDRNIRASGISKMFDSYEDFREVARHATSFDRVAAATWAVPGRLLSGHGPTRGILAMPVTESFFPLLGIAPARGRTFVPEDLKRGCSVVLSDRLWRSTLAADPKIIGKDIRLDDESCTVVGVMSPRFAFYPDATSLWVLLTPNFSPPPDKLPVGIFAHLKPGVTATQAEAEVLRLHAAVHKNDGKERDIVPIVHNLQQEFTFLADVGLRTTLLVLFGAVCFVLLVACLNIANLLLGRSLGRERELAVRAALGGGRRRLLRQLLTENLLFALIGGSFGVGVAFAGIHYFRAVNPVELPIGTRVEISWPVLVFTGIMSVATSILFGLLPAWKASRLDPIEALKAGGRGTITAIPQRWIRGLVAAEMALSLLLLAGAGLLIQSVLNMYYEPLGFNPEGLVVTQITLPSQHYSDAARRLQFYERLMSKFGNQIAIATDLPPRGGSSSTLHVLGKPVSPEFEKSDVGEQTISAGYLKVLGVPLLEGRTFDSRDRVSSVPVVLINEAVAREYFLGVDPIGQRICVGDPGEKNPWRTIIGIVANEKSSRNYHQIGWIDRAQVLKPLSQSPPNSATIAIRGSGAALESALREIDDGVAIGELETMQERLGRVLVFPRFRAFLLGVFAAFALLLAAIGLYGVLRQFVAQRTQEIGVRMAVGAQPRDLLRFIVLQAARPVLTGLLLGLIGSFMMSRYLASLLYDIRPGDPTTLLLVCILLVAVAGLATFLPARRATRVDPLVALRDE
jgi:predicted permease